MEWNSGMQKGMATCTGLEMTMPAVCHDKSLKQQFAACSGLPHDVNHLTSYSC